MIISLRWKISNHMASIGGLTGALIALSLRLEINTSYILALVFLFAGLIGTARLILKKHNPLQIYAGYALGFFVMFFILMFI
jgi:membrane-associated phospholipid phosphatase